MSSLDQTIFYTKGSVAKFLNMSTMKMNAQLRELGIFNKNNMPTKHYSQYFKLETRFHRVPGYTGERPYPFLKISIEGRHLIQDAIEGR